MTWRDLITKLESRQISFKKSEIQPPPPWDGNQCPPYFFENKDGSRFIPVLFKSEDEGVTFSCLRNICNVFEIPMEELEVDSNNPDI
jgi:hypothetical protein